jgi:hypothetical protein
MQARIKGHRGPWVFQVVRATSALQAEEIVRRMGLEVQEGSAQETSEHTSELKLQNPVPLLCDACGYGLNGLVVRAGILDCPECGHPQFIFNREQYVQRKWSNSGCAQLVLGALAVIGGLVVMYICLMFFLFA